MTNPNDPSSPCNRLEFLGLTKRELFAAMAMQGLCVVSGRYSQPEALAADAVTRADTLIAELNPATEKEGA